jgi:hypothetical protein
MKKKNQSQHVLIFKTHNPSNELKPNPNPNPIERKTLKNNPTKS